MAKNKKELKTVRIASAADLTKLTAAPLVARFRLDDTVVELPCRRLTPKEEEQIVAKEREARPRRIPGTATTPEYYDTSSAEYVARRALAEKTARAMAVYMGCPAVSEGRSGLMVPSEIYDYVQNLWTEYVLEILHLTIRGGGVAAVDAEVNERANFTTSPDSDPS